MYPYQSNGNKLPLTAILLVILSEFKGINQLLLPLKSLKKIIGFLIISGGIEVKFDKQNLLTIH